MNKNSKVVASSSVLLVTGKSSRLAAIGQKQHLANSLNSHERSSSTSTELKPEVKLVLAQAVKLVEQKMTGLIKTYPPAKKKCFFKLKYGVQLEDINKMAIKEVFHLLQIKSANVRNFQLVENINCEGNKVL